MPLSLDGILAQAANSGAFSAASGPATLAGGTTAGNTVVIVASTRSTTIATPAGFVRDSPSAVSAAKTFVFRRSKVPAGETSWTLTPTASAATRWWVAELQGLDPDAPLDVVPTSQTSQTSGTTLTTNTTPASTTYDGLVLAVHAANQTGSTVAPTFSGQTNGLVEVDDGGADDGTNSLGMAVSWATTQQLGTWQSTATVSTTLTATNSGVGTIVVYSAAGAKREANIAFFWGFKIGTAAAGLATGLASGGANIHTRYVETMTGTPAVTADGLQLVSTASAQNAATAVVGFQAAPAVNSYVEQVRFRFDGSLPGVDAELLVVNPGGGTPLVLRYVAASGKLGMKVSTGSEVLSAATVAADTWYVVDFRMISTGSAQTVDWQVDDGAGAVTQTQATLGTPAAQGPTRLGWANAITVPGVTFAHLLVSTVAGHYPLGPFTFALLKVDPAGTPTISGTSTNFGVMTANGTIAAWNAANARDAVDEWPPVVGASADGAVCVTAHATDYMEFPMETYAAAPTGSARAVRVVLPWWAASGTACTARVNGWDGTTSTVLFAEADPTTDNTATPGWICKMWRPTGGWTQAKLDAAAIRIGSNDATPDNGPLAVGMEVAVQNAASQGIFGTTGDVTVTGTYDPNSAGILGLATNAAEHAGAALHYETSGSPTDVTVAAAGSRSDTLDAPDAPTTNYVAIYPDPEQDG